MRPSLALRRSAAAAAALFAGALAHPQTAADPVSFGRERLAAAGADADAVHVAIEAARVPESFSIAPRAGPAPPGAEIVAADATGAMYGLLELAERVRRDGARALATTKVTATPFLRDRGLNVFLTLPWDYEKNDTDYDPAALTDPRRWWFQNDDYWSTLLDLMAESRLNWLDLHGTWDVSVTDAPNLYAYFIQSEAFPEVGVAPQIKAKNLERLNRVIEMAHARGVRVSLMAYEARLRTPHRRDPPYPSDEATAYDYTRDVVERMIRQAPGLDAIGFRIGESGRGGEFFRCYAEAVERSGRDLPLLTRSWVTRKAKVVPLARASSDFTVEIKYNGEQWGAPYPFAGGRVANWHSYSFEDYLSDSSALAPADAAAPKRLWPGHPIAGQEGAAAAGRGGARWPDQPYKIVWQVRANGTHRIFPFYEPQWVRRSIEPMKLGTASGFTIEPLNAYYPASPRYYVAEPALLPCEWIHQRDELYLFQWGRLGYDPATSDELFEARLRARFGATAEALSRGWRAASRIVPLSFLAHAFGPDHRDHAPELEPGGDTRAWIEGEGLDTHVFLPIREEMALRATGGSDGRTSALEVADELERLAAAVEAELPSIQRTKDQAPEKARAHELRCALEQLARLGRYHAGRLRSAWWTALAESSPGTAGARAKAHEQLASAREAWARLAGAGGGGTTAGKDAASSFYRPFTERLRMRTNTFSWQQQLAGIERDVAALAALAAAAGEARPRDRAVSAPPPERAALPDARLTWKEEAGTIVASLPARGLDRAWLLHKPLPSSTFFHKVAMERAGERFVGRVPRAGWGHLLAAEIAADGAVRRIPDAFEETPWLVVPSRSGPTPLVYSTEEALAHLDPAVLDPAKHGLIVVAPRAWQFFRSFDPLQQRKLLDAVARGMTLLVLQQDYASGRYPLSWLPEPPKVESWEGEVLDPAGALRLEVVRAPDLVWQRFVATPGPSAGPSAWELPGNGVLAHARFGAGHVWLVQARLIQNLHLPACARALLTLLRSGGVEKPLVLVDPGTEGSRYATSVLPDLLNAHAVPFLTLGEVIAREQGVTSVAVRPGRAWDDLVLPGGAARQQSFQDGQAMRAAASPLPATREELEADRPRQKQLVMQALGLDPLPPRTPLQARVTGVLERDGYRIEKIVFESRPGFPVTAHLYVPADRDREGSDSGAAGADGNRPAPVAAGPRPVILNAHGHWHRKKLEPVVQQRLIQQALHGYLAMVVDSPGHSFEGDARIERRFAGTHFDFRNTLGSMSTTGVYVWDLMRAVDYLETRPEADVARIGITGASGGGLATLWAFAADERLACAVPVCFATSLEVEPHNGCPCNHVPGTLRIGDRADALAVRAPAPVFVIGADDDREFPPAGTRRTGEKLAAIWELFGARDHAAWRIFRSPHDYNLEMIGAALGFFDRHLKGVGDGAPLALEARPTEPPDAPELFCLEQEPAGAVTMRDLAVAKLAAATAAPRASDAAAFVAHNGGGGGLPAGAAAAISARDESGREVPLPRSPAEAKALRGRKLHVTFESEPGLVIPGILWLPDGVPRGAVVLVADAGKRAAEPAFSVGKLLLGGFACFAIDPRGFGELSGIDVRLLVYESRSPAFAAGIDVERALGLLRPICPKVGVVADGPAASLAALSAALVTPDLAAVIGRRSMREFADAFSEDVPLLAIQPQADLLPPLSRLRASVTAPSHFTFVGDPGFDLFAALLRLMKL